MKRRQPTARRRSAQGAATSGSSPDLSAQLLWQYIVLILLLGLSAFGLVYVKDVSRRLFIQLQQSQQRHQSLSVGYGRLLLEQGAWSMQARIQQIAQVKLDMVLPLAKDIVMVRQGQGKAVSTG